MQVDGGPFEELDRRTVSLQTGDHTIVVRDATGNESSPVEIAVPPPLVISSAETTVDEAAGTYRSWLTVQGGTPPYASTRARRGHDLHERPVLPVRSR